MEEIKIFIFQNNLDFIKHWIPFPHNVKLPTLNITDKFLFILPNVHLIITLVHVLASLCKKSWVNELHTGKLFFLMNGYKPLKYTTIIHQWQKKKMSKACLQNTSQTWNGISKDIFKAIFKWNRWSSKQDCAASRRILSHNNIYLLSVWINCFPLAL